MQNVDQPNPASVVQKLKVMLEYALQKGASDLHIACAVPPTVRIQGVIETIPGMQVITREESAALVHSMMTPEQRETFARELEIDFTFGRAGIGRFRVNAYYEQGRVAAALRLIPEAPPELEELGLPPVVGTLSSLRNGLVLVTGPTAIVASESSRSRSPSSSSTTTIAPTCSSARSDAIQGPSRARSQACFARTPTSCLSGRCATTRPSPPRSAPPRPAT